MLYIPTTSANAHYWSAVVDVLSCIYNYKEALDDDEEYAIRYMEFSDAVAVARDAYYYCGASQHIPFGMYDELEVDDFFSMMLLNPGYLDTCYQDAYNNFGDEAAVIPLRAL